MISWEGFRNIFPGHIREALQPIMDQMNEIQEIHLHAQSPILIVKQNQEYYLNASRGLTDRRKDGILVSSRDLEETLALVSGYSLYAFEEELKQGFLTIQGGHRVGITGQIVMEKGLMKTIKFISSMNIRLAHQVRGCASVVLPFLYQNEQVCNTLIISPPGCGKTTLLRDMIRQISDGTGPGRGVRVGVADERSELGACWQGIPQNDLGIRTDILDCCPKTCGMQMLLRTMGPSVIAVDEIGGWEDVEALNYVRNCGCHILATIHGTSMEELEARPVIRKMFQEHIFDRYIFLNIQGKAGSPEQICDGRGNILYPAKPLSV